MFMIFRCLFGKKPQVGEIYIFDEDINNPFIKKRLVKVLEVKGKYLRYEICNSDLFKNESMSIFMFLTLYKRYKNEDNK